MDMPQRPSASRHRKRFFTSGVWLVLCCFLLGVPFFARADPASYGKAKETMSRL